MRKYRKYTRELLEPLVKESTSIAQVIRKLGLKEAGGTHSHISKRIKEYDLDVSHFLGQAANCGKNHKCGTRKSWQEVLVERKEGTREKPFRLRRALIESGRKYKCEWCDQDHRWNGRELVIQIDHKDGNWLNDKPNNLQFLCPNCHSQTEDFCRKKENNKNPKKLFSKKKARCRIGLVGERQTRSA